MTRRPRPLVVVLTVVMLAGLALLGAGPAAAHAARVSADPPVDAALQQGPKEVTATFNEQLQTAFAAMTVVGPDGNLWSTGAVRVTGSAASVDLLPLGPAGRYTVNYRVTSADGHVVSGSWGFELTIAGRGTPGPPAAAAPGSEDELPVWPFVVAAAVIVGAGAWWAARRRA